MWFDDVVKRAGLLALIASGWIAWMVEREASTRMYDLGLLRVEDVRVCYESLTAKIDSVEAASGAFLEVVDSALGVADR